MASGSGENLNEHILGGRWPAAQERLELLEEAVAVMRELWRGGMVNHHGSDQRGFFQFWQRELAPRLGL